MNKLWILIEDLSNKKLYRFPHFLEHKIPEGFKKSDSFLIRDKQISYYDEEGNLKNQFSAIQRFDLNKIDNL